MLPILLICIFLNLKQKGDRVLKDKQYSIQRRIIRHHREMSHHALKAACRKLPFKRRLISHLGQMQYMAPLLTSITLKQFRGLIEEKDGVYAFEKKLPAPDKHCLWVELTTVKLETGDVDLYYKLDNDTIRLSDSVYRHYQLYYNRLTYLQSMLYVKDIHPITVSIIERRLRRLNPIYLN